MKDTESIRSKLERFERTKERLLESLEVGKVPDENLTETYLRIGNKYQAIGLYRMALEDCTDARSDFEQSAEWYHKGVRETRRRRDDPSDDFVGGVRLLKYLYSAVLTGDTAVIEQATEAVVETHESHYERSSTIYRYHLLQGLAAILQDTGTQRLQLEELQTTLKGVSEEHQHYFGALGQALTGIVDHDGETFSDGVDQFLEWHDDNVDFETKTSARDLVCLQVVVLVVLARRSGMAGRIDSEYLPECTSELI